MLATAVSLPVDLDWDEKSLHATPTKAVVTRVDLFGRRGLTSGEVRAEVEALGSAERFEEVLSWVEKAHRHLEYTELRRNNPGRTGFQGLQAAHPKAVDRLDLLLEGQWQRYVRSVTYIVDEINRNVDLSKEKVSFPRVRDWRELEDILACALNINMYIAQRGGYACNCAAMPEFRKPKK